MPISGPALLVVLAVGVTLYTGQALKQHVLKPVGHKIVKIFKH